MQVAFDAREFEFRPREIDFAGNDFEARECRGLNLVRQRTFAQQWMIGTAALGFFEAEATGGVGLRVEIDEQDALTTSGKACGKVDGGGGFTHPALLVGDGYNWRWHGWI
jgi:hypothetical protein